MKLKALKKRARSSGVDEDQLEDADDADDIKAAVIQLIVEAQASSCSTVDELLRAELSGLKLKALKRRARDAGVDEEKLEDADDADDIKAAVIELIVHN